MANIAREKTGQSWADISVSCSLRRHGIALLPIKGLYGWRMEGKPKAGTVLNTGYIKAIRASKPLAITFHYINVEEMRAIHAEFKALQSNTSAVNSSRRMSSEFYSREAEYDVELADFIAKENAWNGLNT